MKRWIKVLLIGAALVVSLVAGLLVTAYLLFDAEKIKTALIESVAEKTGRRLAIEGLPKLHVWPQLSIRLGKVSLSEKLGDEVFAGVDHVSVAIGVLPLLSGELRADTVEVSGLRARVVRYVSGSFNFSDLLAGEPSASAADQPPAAAPAAAGSPLRFAIAGIRIGGHELAWQDDLAKRRIALSDFTLDTGELGIDAGGELSFAGTVSIADGATAAPAERLRVSLRSAYRLAAESVVLNGLRGEIDGTFAGISELKLGVAGERIALAPATAAVDASGLTVDFDGKLAAMTLQAKLTLPQLAWQESAPASGTQRLSLPGATLAATIEQPPRRIEASLRSAVTLSLPALDLALADMAGEVLASDPQLLRQPVRLVLAGAATANLERLGAAFKGTLSVDDSRAVLDLALDSPQPLSARASVDLDQLDFDRYLLPPAPAPAAAGAPPQPAGDVPVDLSPLAGKTIKARIGVGRLKVREIVAEQIRIEASLANGKLEVAPLAAKVYSGQVEARLTANAANRALALRARLDGVSLNPLLRDVAKFDLLSGRANVDADLQSSGATVAALKAALAGELRLRVADGAVKGINLAQRFRELKGRGAPADAAAGDAQEATDFTELTGSFKIRDGVVRGDDLAAKSPFLRLAGAGQVDLPQETLDYLLKASVVNTSAGQGGEGLDHLRGLTIPVRLSGPLAQPKWKIEIGSLLDDAAKARVAEKKTEIKAKTQEAIGEKREALRDKAKDKLKGLLGR